MHRYAVFSSSDCCIMLDYYLRRFCGCSMCVVLVRMGRSSRVVVQCNARVPCENESSLPRP